MPSVSSLPSSLPSHNTLTTTYLFTYSHTHTQLEIPYFPHYTSEDGDDMIENHMYYGVLGPAETSLLAVHQVSGAEND